MQEEKQIQAIAPRKVGNLEFYDLGFWRDYGQVWDFQKELLAKRIERKIPDSVIVVEHDHVLTLGRSSHTENILVKDLPVFEIERGGDVTYHGPGQLVAYPIISLEARSIGIRQFIEILESSIIDVLSSLGIKNSEGRLGSATGIWISGKRKVASIGVAVSHWVTYHGVALNVNTDLSFFQKIKPCGFDAQVMTSVSKELSLPEVDMGNVKDRLVTALAKHFFSN